MAKLIVDQNTGEVLSDKVMVFAEKAPSVVIDIQDVVLFHKEPEKLAEKIRDQAGFAVFDISTKSGRDACRSHAANIIKCIAPACKKSTELAEEAKLVVKQDLHFRKTFENMVREIAEYHRKPLTEWEEEQARIKELERLENEKREAEAKYLSDWTDALAFNELFDLKREKEAADIAKKRAELESEILAKKAWAKQHADGYQFLFADMAQLVQMQDEEFKKVVLDRVAKYQSLPRHSEAKVEPKTVEEKPKRIPTVTEMIDHLSHHYGVDRHEIRQILKQHFMGVSA